MSSQGKINGRGILIGRASGPAVYVSGQIGHLGILLFEILYNFRILHRVLAHLPDSPRSLRFIRRVPGCSSTKI